MSCKRYQKQIILFLDGELRQDLADELNRHVLGCKRCKEALTNLRNVYRLIEVEKSEFHVDANLSVRIIPKLESRASSPLSRLSLRYATITSLAAAGIALGVLIGTLYNTSSNEIKSTSTQDWEQLTEEYMPEIENNPYNLLLTINETPTKP